MLINDLPNIYPVHASSSSTKWEGGYEGWSERLRVDIDEIRWWERWYEGSSIEFGRW